MSIATPRYSHFHVAELQTTLLRHFDPRLPVAMALRQLTSAPKVEDFTPLQEHQEQTPSTFFGAKPVLYARHSGLTLSASASKLQEDPAFQQFNSIRDGDSEDALIQDVEIWVNSE